MKRLNSLSGARILSNHAKWRITVPTQGPVDQSPRRIDGSLMKAPRRKERKHFYCSGRDPRTDSGTWEIIVEASSKEEATAIIQREIAKSNTPLKGRLDVEEIGAINGVLWNTMEVTR